MSSPETTVLPESVEALQALVRSMQHTLDTERAEHRRQEGENGVLRERITVLLQQLVRLRRQQHGRRSEKLDTEIGQLELTLGDLEAQNAELAAGAPAVEPNTAPAVPPPRRQPLVETDSPAIPDLVQWTKDRLGDRPPTDTCR